MSHRTIDKDWVVYRIGDLTGDYAVKSAEGARLHGGRWNDAGQAVLYTSGTLSLAMLEKLVHFDGNKPDGQHYAEFTIPEGTTYEIFPQHDPANAGWNSLDSPQALAFGMKWFQQMRSCILIVPSTIVPIERNILVNTHHHQYSTIRSNLEEPVYWDGRLLG